MFKRDPVSTESIGNNSTDASRTVFNSPAMKEGIFLIGPSFPFRGGIAHYNTLLYNHLSKTHTVMFYTFKKQYFKWLFPGNSDRDNSAEKIEPDNLQVESTNGSSVKRILHPLNLKSWLKAGKEAGEYRLILLPWWVVFWAPYYYVFLKAAKRRCNSIKIIFLCHNVVEHEGKTAGKLKRFLSRSILRHGDGFILHSRGQENQLNQLLNLKTTNKPVLVSPHPLYQVFNKDRYTASNAREELGILPKRKVILFFGFIREYKGLSYLLKALPVIKAVDPGILLLIVGEVWNGKSHYERYVRIIWELGLEENTRFINRYVPNEEVEVYFKASDMVILPYLDGGGSGILQIAYGMNRPVVATRINAFQDVVEEGKTGALVSPADENQLAGAIIEMYRNDAFILMETGIREYKTRFEWSAMVEKITHFYNS